MSETSSSGSGPFLHHKNGSTHVDVLSRMPRSEEQIHTLVLLPFSLWFNNEEKQGYGEDIQLLESCSHYVSFFFFFLAQASCSLLSEQHEMLLVPGDIYSQQASKVSFQSACK